MGGKEGERDPAEIKQAGTGLGNRDWLVKGDTDCSYLGEPTPAGKFMRLNSLNPRRNLPYGGECSYYCHLTAGETEARGIEVLAPGPRVSTSEVIIFLISWYLGTICIQYNASILNAQVPELRPVCSHL